MLCPRAIPFYVITTSRKPQQSGSRLYCTFKLHSLQPVSATHALHILDRQTCGTPSHSRKEQSRARPPTPPTKSSTSTCATNYGVASAAYHIFNITAKLDV